MRKIIKCLVVLVLLASSGEASIITVENTDAKAIRNVDGVLDIVDFLSVAYIEEPSEYLWDDRTILEFNISGLTETIPFASLDFGLDNRDPDPPDGTIDVYNFTGDGIVTLDDVGAGGDVPFTSFIGLDDDISIDVTSILHDALNTGDQFLSFRLSTITGDRYMMGSIVGQPMPVLTIIPEPATVFLLGLGCLALRSQISKRSITRRG